MVTTYGMSDELGPMAYGTNDDEVFLGRDFNKIRNYSEEVAAKIDKEMRRIIDNAYHKTEKLLSENMKEQQMHYQKKKQYQARNLKLCLKECRFNAKMYGMQIMKNLTGFVSVDTNPFCISILLVLQCLQLL